MRPAGDRRDIRPRSLVSRMVRAARLDGRLYEEVEADAKAIRQAFLTVILAGLAAGIGIGAAGMFAVAGVWSVWVVAIGLVFFVAAWLLWSFFAYLIGTKVLKGPETSATVGEVLRAAGFSTSPAVLAVFSFIPVVGGFILGGALLWVLIAGLVAARQALDFGNARAILTCLASWFACILVAFLAFVPLSSYVVGGSCAVGGDFDRRLGSIVRPYRFSILTWELTSVPHEFGQLLRGTPEDPGEAAGIVIEYFSSDEEGRRLAEDTVEKLLEGQIKEALAREDVSGFPPVNLRLGELPRLLVISPRDRIESIREIMLLPDVSLEDIEGIEARADQLGVSSLVVSLGGYGGAYPSFVTNSAGLQATIDTAVEEWMHQRLAFTPLGFRYVLDLLGLERNYDIATINETVAGMVSEEIGAMIRAEYYPGEEEGARREQEEQPGFDFNREMRETRIAVDEYLARGETELAEEFMEQKRQYLASQGHYIRKLNQAYFAWHGTYADEPTSVSPIGAELRELRAQSMSVKDFLDTVSRMTSREDLRDSVGALPQGR